MLYENFRFSSFPTIPSVAFEKTYIWRYDLPRTQPTSLMAQRKYAVICWKMEIRRDYVDSFVLSETGSGSLDGV